MRRPVLRALLGLAAAVQVLFFALPLLAVPARFAALRGWAPCPDTVLRALGVMALSLGIGTAVAARRPEHHRGVVLVVLMTTLGAGALGLISVAARGGNLWVAIDTAMFLTGAAGCAFLFPREPG